MAPDLSLAGVRLVIADRAMGLPVLRTLSLCTCRRHYPGAASERIFRSFHPDVSVPRPPLWFRRPPLDCNGRRQIELLAGGQFTWQPDQGALVKTKLSAKS